MYNINKPPSQVSFKGTSQTVMFFLRKVISIGNCNKVLKGVHLKTRRV